MANDPSDAGRLQGILAKTTAAALAVSGVEGEAVFDDLARHLAGILEVDATMIGRFDPDVPDRVIARATYADGRLLRQFDYDISTTPCRAMVNRESRFVASGVNGEFAPGTLFQTQGFDSYAARSLVDAGGRQIGLIVALHRRPMTDRALIEALLQIFAVRAGAELEREQVSLALRNSEASYRAIFEASEDAIFIHDQDTGAILDVSPKAAELYGHTREALRHLRVGEISANVPPYTEADAVRHVQRARDSEVPLRIEWRARHRDGRLLWNEVTLKRAQIAGEPRVLAFVRDITDRKEADEALRLREEQYRAIFNVSADALVLWNDQMEAVEVNPAFERIYGFSREELVGKSYPEYLPAEYVRGRAKLVRRALAGETCELETRAYRRDGSVFDVELRVLPIRYRGAPHVLAIARDITDRKRTEEALRASEEQYRAIFNASADALVLWDGQYRRVDVNLAYQKMYGWERDEVIGRGYEHPRFSPGYARPRLELVRRALAGESCHAELEAVRRDGTRVLTEVHAIPFRHRGEPHVLASARDITERKRAEEALRAGEEQYRAIFNASVDGLVLKDGNHRIVDVNAAFLSMHGYEREELLGRRLSEFIPDELQARCDVLVPEILAGQPCHLEAKTRRRDGTTFDVEIHGVPMQYGGRPHALVIMRDVTGSKQAEQALRDSEEQYRAIFNASADALVLRDADFHIVDVNATYEAMSGYPRDAVIGAARVFANPPEVADTIRTLHERALGGEPIVFETTLLRRDGARYDLELRGVPIQHRGAPHVLYMGRDVTDRAQSERQRRDLEAQLRQAQKMEAIGHLTGGIAHDFNNILTSVMGYVVLATERPAAESDPKLLSHLEQAQQSCRRARDLIQQMLAFSRGRRGEPRRVGLRALLSESSRMLRATLPSTVDIDVRVEGEPCALVDPVQAHQVLLNLCINARDAMDEAGRIKVTARHCLLPTLTCTSCRRSFSGEFVEIAVSDSGRGIPSNVLERMFEPFFTTKGVGQGTGMGLSIVHGVVHEHGGHVLVDPGRGTGTTFRVLLPPASASADHPPSDHDGRRALRDPLRGRVLLVEDEQSVLGFMRELLQGWGLTVVAAQEPADALNWFALEPDSFDLVLTDQTMPGMTGLELARALVAARPELPVLLYSGRSELMNADAAAAAGIRRLLPKPIEASALHAALRDALPAHAGGSRRV
ncbi:MAG: PAS domain S-box protein [Burkholderiaceae bacterium]|jgi:PAS domain S-box-containing protein|nr:PAS domain S-box protein [Burkholderiaceae bacterium]